MSRKKAEFKNLGTLEPGEWTVIQATTSGALILTCSGCEPMCLFEGKLTTLIDNMKGSPDASEES